MVNLRDLRNLGHFATLYQWDVNVLQFPALGKYGYPSSDAVNFRCVSAELPMMSNQGIEIQVRGHHIRQHGIWDYTHSLSLQFVETLDNSISLMLASWREACWETDTGNQGTKQEVEATFMMARLDNQKTPIWQYILYGCLLDSYDPGGMLDAANSDAVRPSMTLSYDFFEDQPL